MTPFSYRLGVSFEGEDTETGELIVVMEGHEKRFKRLEVLEFDSGR